eukprot:4052247-Pyramimonas_sp.AAC.1
MSHTLTATSNQETTTTTYGQKRRPFFYRAFILHLEAADLQIRDKHREGERAYLYASMRISATVPSSTSWTALKPPRTMRLKNGR